MDAIIIYHGKIVPITHIGHTTLSSPNLTMNFPFQYIIYSLSIKNIFFAQFCWEKLTSVDFFIFFVMKDLSTTCLLQERVISLSGTRTWKNHSHLVVKHILLHQHIHHFIYGMLVLGIVNLILPKLVSLHSTYQWTMSSLLHSVIHFYAIRVIVYNLVTIKLQVLRLLMLFTHIIVSLSTYLVW